MQPQSACNAHDWNTELVPAALQAVEEQVEHEGEDGDDIPPPSPSESEFQSDFGPELDWDVPAAADPLGRVINTFPGTFVIFERGETFLSWFDSDLYAVYQKQNLYYPFASLDDWKMASFLLTSRLSMNAIDNFLSLQAVRST